MQTDTMASKYALNQPKKADAAAGTGMVLAVVMWAVLAHEKAVNDVVKCLNQLCQHNGRSSFQENASDGGSTEEFVLIFGCHKMSSTFCFAGVVFDTIWLQDTSRRQLRSSWLSSAEKGDSPQCGEMSRRDKREGHPLNRGTSCSP